MSVLPNQTIDFSVPNPAQTANLSLPLYQGAGYREDFKTWSLLVNGGFMKFNLKLSEAVPVEWTMNICASLVDGKANCPISMTVNGKAFVNSYSDHNANFHDESWTIPTELLVQGDNTIIVSLDNTATTQLFIRAVTVDQAVLQPQAIDFTVPNPQQTQNLSLPLYQGAGYRSDYKTWSLLVNGGFMRFNLNIAQPAEIILGVSNCAALVNGVADSPSTVTVNGKELGQLDPKSGNFGTAKLTIAATMLGAGNNEIQITLDESASGQLFINSVGVEQG